MTRRRHDRHPLPLPGGLHGHPPLTPAAVLVRWRPAVPLILLTFMVLAVLAAINDGSALLTWDRPVQEWVEGLRTDDGTSVVRAVSQLGGTTVVVVGSALVIIPVYRRCHSLGVVLLVAVASRPLLEWTLKTLVDRPRPDLERLVAGTGPSFPTGHVMAAVALWGLVPPLVALITHRRVLWWASVVLSGLVVLGVAISRTYLGVHWLSDIVGALLLGNLYLLGVEYLFDWHHDRFGCRFMDEAEADLLRPPNPP